MSENKSKEEIAATIDVTHENTTPNIESLSKGKIVICYALAFLLVSLILFGISTVIKEFFIFFSVTEDVGRLDVVTTVGALYLLYVLTKNLGDTWRAGESSEIGTGITNFPNPFIDRSFVKGPVLIRREFHILSTRYKSLQLLLQKAQASKKESFDMIKSFETKLRVLLRHNENSNRILKSYNFLMKAEDTDISRKMLSHTLSECITILERDQSDKSISLFEVRGEELVIIESHRINAESVAKRVFKKGEGFAGSIWASGETEIANNISDDPRFLNQLPANTIGSIIGIPLKVEEEIIGVLCLQSEIEEGFTTADLRTVEFYARMCTHIILSDRICYNKYKGADDYGNGSGKN